MKKSVKVYIFKSFIYCIFRTTLAIPYSYHTSTAILVLNEAPLISPFSGLSNWSSVCSHFSWSTEELLDEDNHLGLLDSAWSVLVEGGENLIEGFIRELISGSKVTEGILNEFLGLILVESTALVDIIGVPDLVDNTLNGLFFSWHCFLKMFG